MKVVTAAQMRELDRAAIQERGIPSLALMEQAGMAVARAVQRLCPAPGPIGILLGRGNNAGDGLVAARLLRDAGYTIRCVLTGPPADFSPDAKTNWERCAATPATLAELATCRCLVDALLGTGLTRAVQAPLSTVIQAANASGLPIVAADIPSGLCADTGQPLGIAIRARHTVCLGLPKLGLILPPGPEYVGTLEIADIGFPSDLVAAVQSPYRLNEPSEFRGDWPQRRADSHKGDYGHILVIGGSLGMSGAGALCAKAALRSGAGLVTYALPTAAFTKIDPQALEVMTAPLPDDGTGSLIDAALPTLKTLLAKKQAVALGPGLGQGTAITAALRALLPQIRIPLVLDADGLNGLAAEVASFDWRARPTVMTPHPGEMARLAGISTEAVQADRLGIATAFAQAHGVWLVLKGYRSVIAAPDGECIINPTGNAGMATAGAGDVLTGILAGLLGQGMPMRAAVLAGVYGHGLAGDIAAAHTGQRALIASDIIEALPQAWRLIAGDRMSEGSTCPP